MSMKRPPDTPRTSPNHRLTPRPSRAKDPRRRHDDRPTKATLWLRPDRIVIGELRGGEASALLKAWDTGHTIPQ